MAFLKPTSLFLLILTFALITHVSVAQTYVQSYYISTKGDTIKGTALTDAYSNLSKSVDFKLKNGKIIVLKPENIREVWLAPDWYFVAKSVHFRNKSVEFNGFCFLQLRSKTDSVSLFKFEQDAEWGYFIERKGDSLRPLQIFINSEPFDVRAEREARHYVTDTLSTASEYLDNNMVGKIRFRKIYLHTFWQTFPYCTDILIANYQLTEQDILAAFHYLAKYSHKKPTDFFKKKAWRPKLGLNIGQTVAIKNYGYTMPVLLGGSLSYDDLRNEIELNINWLKAEPALSFLIPTKGSFMEYALNYNRTVLLTPRFKAAVSVGLSNLRTNNLFYPSAPAPYQVVYLPVPKNDIFYLLGVQAQYQFMPNNYLGVRFSRSFRDLRDGSSNIIRYDVLKLKYEYRF